MSSAELLKDLRDESTFTALFERHRGELQVHCYRMLGSYVDSEDLLAQAGRLRSRRPPRVPRLALPHRHERLPRRAAQQATPGPAT
jgi:hypothetical protein